MLNNFIMAIKDNRCCGQLWVRLVMDYTTSHFTWSNLGYLRIPPDQVSPSQTWSTFKGHFEESLIVRLYSEIDHIHLSSEAQCVSHLYPQVDCHSSGHVFDSLKGFEGGWGPRNPFTKGLRTQYGKLDHS